MYTKIKNNIIEQYPFYIQTLKQQNPLVSFANNLELDYTTLKEYDIYRVFPTAQPEYDLTTHKVIEVNPIYSKDRYNQSWQIVELSIEEKLQIKLKIQQDILNKVQNVLDNFAKGRNYDSILSATTYLNSNVAKFVQEAKYAIDARDATWNKVYSIFNEVDLGLRPNIKSYEEIEQELPILQWP